MCHTASQSGQRITNISRSTKQVKWKSCLMKFFASFTPASLPHCPLAWSWTNCLLFKTAHPPLYPKFSGQKRLSRQREQNLPHWPPFATYIDQWPLLDGFLQITGRLWGVHASKDIHSNNWSVVTRSKPRFGEMERMTPVIMRWPRGKVLWPDGALVEM